MKHIKKYRFFESVEEGEDDFFISEEDIKDIFIDLIDDGWNFGEDFKFFLTGNRKYKSNVGLSDYYPIHQFELISQVVDSDESYDGSIYYSDTDHLDYLTKSLGMLKRLLGKGFKIKYNINKTSDFLITKIRIIYPMVKGSQFNINEFFNFVTEFNRQYRNDYYFAYPMNINDFSDGDFFVFGLSDNYDKQPYRSGSDEIEFNWESNRYVGDFPERVLYNREADRIESVLSRTHDEMESIEKLVNDINFRDATMKDSWGVMRGNITHEYYTSLKNSFMGWVKQFSSELNKRFNVDIKYDGDESPYFLDNKIGVRSMNDYEWVIVDTSNKVLVRMEVRMAEVIRAKVYKKRSSFFKDDSISLDFPIYSLGVTFKKL
jgi:hypothetical protein